jgi:DNA-binding NarL/FixJ family response regulator
MGHRPAPRVLIVEDSTLIAMDLENILKNCGCQIVGPRYSLEQALDALAQDAFDVAVVDYRLANCTAAPFLDALNKRGVPFAICTGAEASEIRTLYPHTAILAKPYAPEDVALVVNSLIASLLART